MVLRGLVNKRSRMRDLIWSVFGVLKFEGRMGDF